MPDVTGTVISAKGQTVEVATDYGRTVRAIVPLQWFSAKGNFDICKSLQLGLRVRVKLLAVPKQNRLIAILPSENGQ